jgi:uncharacterized glyoxalase superfamily protein PhnB
MISNRSVPTDTLLPHLVYADVGAAVEWLTQTYGFSEHYHYGDEEGHPSGAQIHLGNAWMMLKASAETPARLGGNTQSLTVFVEDVDAHFERAREAGAKIVEELHETVYGERQYGTEDLQGHFWLFSAHAKDLSPDEWGATLVSQ